jgi:NAD-dependent deacetylase
VDALIAEAAERLGPLQDILFVTGAGISADSGLPTYRGVGGLYDAGETEDGLPIEVCLSGAMFRQDPGRTWRYIREIEAACRGARPNPAHSCIAELERSRERIWVLTQNVDGLHAAAGSEQLISIHGDVHELRCTACSWRDRVADFRELDERIDAQLVPSCPRCDAPIRPDVVLFGELLPPAEVERLQAELARGFDAVVSIGTTALFPYIAAPVLQARAAGRLTIEINPGVSEVSGVVDLHLKLGAAAAMQALCAVMA